MNTTLALCKELVTQKSVTPDTSSCLQIIAQRLQNIGFEIEYLKFEDVNNLWAKRGSSSPLFVFAGHTDVVPTGPESQWKYPPFSTVEHNGFLYGRGTADMKGSIAAMCTAVERFVTQHAKHTGSIAFLITADEEGPSINGTKKVIAELVSRQEKIDWCLVDEPSSSNKLGDVIKNGRRGSLNGHLTLLGKQGHVAYPELASNPIHLISPFLTEICAIEWDKGNDYFPPSSFQISNITSGTGAENVIPGELKLQFNFRFSTEVTAEQLKQTVIDLLDKHKLQYSLNWRLSGEPFITEQGKLVQAVSQSIKKQCAYETTLSTAGGTSDGRFIAPTGAQVVELGPLNATIHQVDEHVSIEDLENLSLIYELTLENLFL